MEYIPDNWVVLKINYDGMITYRVLAGWSGGYLYGDSWRMNSGITRVEEDGNYYEFYGSSGSCYRCHKKGYRISMAIGPTYSQLKEHFGDAVELMPKDTDWSNLV